MNYFHPLDIEFNKIFIIFGIEQTLEIFRFLMLDTKILFFSKEIKYLTPIIVSLLCLLFPFK